MSDNAEHELRVLRARIMDFPHVVITEQQASECPTGLVPIWAAHSIHRWEYQAWTLAYKLTKETDERYTVRKLREDSL